VAAKLNLVIVLAAAGGMLWVEHAHRIKIEASAPAEVAGRNATCPENESVPFSVDCMTFIQGGNVQSDVRPPGDAIDGPYVESPEQP
jgi:hypothetical protein